MDDSDSQLRFLESFLAITPRSNLPREVFGRSFLEITSGSTRLAGERSNCAHDQQSDADARENKITRKSCAPRDINPRRRKRSRALQTLNQFNSRSSRKRLKEVLVSVPDSSRLDYSSSSSRSRDNTTKATKTRAERTNSSPEFVVR